MPKQRTFRVSDVLRVKEELRSMPERSAEEVSGGEAVAMLSAELRALKRRNYSDAQIVDLLRDNGILVSLSVLKKRLSKTANVGRKRGRRAAAGTVTSEEQTRSPGATQSTTSTSPSQVSSAKTGSTARSPSLGSRAGATESPDGDRATGLRPPAVGDAHDDVPGDAREPPAETVRPQPVVPIGSAASSLARSSPGPGRSKSGA
jgi:hypothetical protein